MKHLFITCLFVFCFFIEFCFSQNYWLSPYEDSRNLIDNFNNINNSKTDEDYEINIANILNKYLKEPISFADIKNGNFFNDSCYLKHCINKLMIKKIKSVNILTAQSSEGTPITNFSLPTLIADGTAKFIAKRFKDELTEAFFKKFRKELCDSTGALVVIKSLFPKTINILCNMEPTQYEIFLPSLQNAFESDFADCPENITKLVWEKVNNSNMDNRINILTGLDLIKLINNKNGDISQILENLDNPEYIQKIDSLSPVFKNILTISSILTRNSQKSNGNYLTTSDFQIMLSNEIHLELYTGLVLLREKSKLESIKIGSNESSTLYSLLNCEKCETLIKLMIKFSDKIQVIKQFVNTRTKNNSNISQYTPDDFFQFVGYSLDVIESVIKGYSLLNSTQATEIDTTFANIRIKINDFQEITRSAQSKEWGVLLGEIIKIMPEYLPEFKNKKEFLKYGTFMVAVVSAKTSDDICNVLETVALPVNSWQMNRENKLNITLNSYAGAMAAFPGRWFTGQGKANFIAPVGLTFSFRPCDSFALLRKGKDWDCFWGWTLGILVPQAVHLAVADLGPIVNLRLNNKDASLPEMHWSDLLSPGIYGVWNIPEVPFSFGAGVQYAPQYSITAENSSTIKNEMRWNIFLAVDIPILGIYAIK